MADTIKIIVKPTEEIKVYPFSPRGGVGVPEGGTTGEIF